MKNRALLSAIAICFAVVGCSKPEEAVKPKPVASAPTPKPPEAPVAQPGSSGPAKTDAPATKATPAEIEAARKAGCKADQCKVDITVSDCKITVTPPVLGVSTTGKDVELRWNLKAPDYAFTDNGITFKDPGTQFSGKYKQSDDTFKWRDANSDAGVYDYTVEVKAKKDGTICRLDPSIINGAS
jgi:hypothetical protein